MFVTLLMFRDWVIREPVFYLFAFYSLLVWVRWGMNVYLARKYQPWVKSHVVSTGVIIPVVDEPEDIFRNVLRLITQQNPTAVVVVINGARNELLETICAEYGVITHWTRTPGKRNAIREGKLILNETGLIGPNDPVLLVDSDTIWTDDNDGTLAELCKPFADPRVGGVTTRQLILNPTRSFLTRWANWLESTRGLYSQPAQSRLGQIGCLPGRTIAFRSHILDAVMHDFMTERYMGVFLEVSDDRTLTNLTLRAGYRTVYQSSSVVYTDAPTKLPKLFRQQLRWARGSTYNNWRQMPWYASHAPFTGFMFFLDMLQPFLLLGAILGWAYRAVTKTGQNYYQPILDTYPGWVGYIVIALAVVILSCLSMWLRQYWHWREHKTDMIRIPFYILFSTAFLMPIRILGFFRMAHVAGWGTRAGAYEAGDEQAPAGKDQQPNLENIPARADNAKLNPYAVIPYVVGFTVLALEIWVSVHNTYIP